MFKLYDNECIASVIGVGYILPNKIFDMEDNRREQSTKMATL